MPSTCCSVPLCNGRGEESREEWKLSTQWMWMLTKVQLWVSLTVAISSLFLCILHSYYSLSIGQGRCWLLRRLAVVGIRLFRRSLKCNIRLSIEIELHFVVFWSFLAVFVRFAVNRYGEEAREDVKEVGRCGNSALQALAAGWVVAPWRCFGRCDGVTITTVSHTAT